MYDLIIHYYPDLNGYVVTCPDFPNVRAFGRTVEEARRVAEVIEMWY